MGHDEGVRSSESARAGHLNPPARHALTVRVEHYGDAVVLCVSGEIDLETAPHLQEAVSAALDEHPETLIIDLSKVEFLASAGMTVLIRCQQQAGTRTRFRVVAGGSATFRPMDLVGVSKQIVIFPTREEALAAD